MSLPHDELDWLAFRYVAGDLSDAEALAFEARLGDDQAAREAVSDAVALAGLLREAAAPAPTVRPSWGSASWTSLSWVKLALASAACVALVATAGRFDGWSDRSPAVSPELAEAWSSRLEGTPAAESDDAAFEADSVAELVQLPEAVPSWMIEAVRDLEGSSDSTDAGAEEMES